MISCGGHLVFQNEAKNISSHNFMAINMSCKFEKSTYNTLASRGLTRKSLRRRLSGGYNKVRICVIYIITNDYTSSYQIIFISKNSSTSISVVGIVYNTLEKSYYMPIFAKFGLINHKGKV